MSDDRLRDIEDELLRHTNLVLTPERAGSFLSVVRAALDATPEPTDDRLREALKDARRLAHPFSLSPRQRERIVARIDEALDAAADIHNDSEERPNCEPASSASYGATRDMADGLI